MKTVPTPSEPTKHRPEGPIAVQRALQRDIRPNTNAAFSFEKRAHILEIVLAEGTPFLRRINYTCAAGANGRPEYYLEEAYFDASQVDTDALTAENWQGLLPESPVYRCDGWDIGALY